MKRRSKADPISILDNIVIESHIDPPPVNLTSPWTHLVFKMKFNQSCVLDRQDYVLKFKYACIRLGFGFSRRRISESEWRVWKIERTEDTDPKKPKIPDRAYYADRGMIVISGSKQVKKKRVRG